MPDLIQLITRILGPDCLFGSRQYRPEAQVLGRRMMLHNETVLTGSPYAPLYLQEAGTGLGKTSVELLYAFLLAALEGQRTLIATNTIALRTQLKKEAETVQKLMEQAFAKFGLPKPRKIIVRSLDSSTQFISPTRVHRINDWVKRSASDADRAEWQEFYDFVEDAMDAEHGLDEEPALARIHDWFDASDGKPLPLKLGTLNLCLDTEQDSQCLDRVTADWQNAYGADVLIVTQTMLHYFTRRLRFYDAMERSGKPIKHDCGAYDRLIVDEAHTLSKVVRSNVEQVIYFTGDGSIRETLDEVPDIDDIRSKLDALESYVIEKVGSRTSFPIDRPAERPSFNQVVEPFYAALLALLEQMIEQGGHQEPVLAAKIENILAAFQPIVRSHFRAGTGDGEIRDISDADAYPFLVRRGSNYGVSFKAGNVGRILSSLWRRPEKNPKSRLYKSVIMLSGTLKNANADPLDRYRHFRFSIGATQTMETPQRHSDVVRQDDAIPATSVGYATRVIFAERSTDLLPSLRREDENGNWINPLHIEYLVGMIAKAFNERRAGNNRILCLFMSDDALDRAFRLIQDRYPTIAAHVIAQRKRTFFTGRPLALFRADPRSVLFSLNWQGINAVDEQERSLVKHLVISKLPFSPVNERMQHENPAAVGINITFQEAIWTLRQGIGRAMRDSTARFTLWICDSRMPLPAELVRHGYPKYVSQQSDVIRRKYDLFDEVIARRLFGQQGTGLLGKPAQLGYLMRNLDLHEHDVSLSPRPADRIRIDPVATA